MTTARPSHTLLVGAAAAAFAWAGGAAGCAELEAPALESPSPGPAEDDRPVALGGNPGGTPVLEASVAAAPQVALGTFRGRVDPQGALQLAWAPDGPAPPDGASGHVARAHDAHEKAATAAQGYCGDLRTSTRDVRDALVLRTVAGSVGRDVAACVPLPERADWGPLMYDEGGAFCATVQVDNRLGVPIAQLVAQIHHITAGYEGYRWLTAEPSPCCGTGLNVGSLAPVSNRPTDLTGGLWLFGDLAPGGSAQAQWTFRNPGGSFEFEGRLLAVFTELENGEDDDCDGVADNGLRLFAEGAPCASSADCASSLCTDDRCGRPPGPPTVATLPPNDVTATTAMLNGAVTGLGEPRPGQHGFCVGPAEWPAPGEADVFCSGLGEVSATGGFTELLTGLVPSTSYHARAYAQNEHGPGYGVSVPFTTLGAP